ncbi:heavy metal-binding domain-containing protein [Acidithiobacillus ferridurans]|uniref:heavy metal-binding domain-containing protein n=1 Tax=Acidithiobacillus ferridurans TaxID=1232575 RepID=UPI001C07A739|nr:heavy metal-binding domain-containing protein [Acidithiobacillus ferridurans]MBU2733850.1 YbjQ family protein [Acidithiobacillus ferridurans]
MDHGSKVIIPAINGCLGRQIVLVMGSVYGTGVRSRNIAGNFLGGVRAIFGGKQ